MELWLCLHLVWHKQCVAELQCMKKGHNLWYYTWLLTLWCCYHRMLCRNQVSTTQVRSHGMFFCSFLGYVHSSVACCGTSSFLSTSSSSRPRPSIINVLCRVQVGMLQGVIALQLVLTIKRKPDEAYESADNHSGWAPAALAGCPVYACSSVNLYAKTRSASGSDVAVQIGGPAVVISYLMADV